VAAERVGGPHVAEQRDAAGAAVVVAAPRHRPGSGHEGVAPGERAGDEHRHLRPRDGSRGSERAVGVARRHAGVEHRLDLPVEQVARRTSAKLPPTCTVQVALDPVDSVSRNVRPSAPAASSACPAPARSSPAPRRSSPRRPRRSSRNRRGVGNRVGAVTGPANAEAVPATATPEAPPLRQTAPRPRSRRARARRSDSSFRQDTPRRRRRAGARAAAGRAPASRPAGHQPPEGGPLPTQLRPLRVGAVGARGADLGELRPGFAASHSAAQLPSPQGLPSPSVSYSQPSVAKSSMKSCRGRVVALDVREVEQHLVVGQAVGADLLVADVQVPAAPPPSRCPVM